MTSLTNHPGNPIAWCENQFATIKCAPATEARQKAKKKATKTKALLTLVIWVATKPLWMCQSQSSEVKTDSRLGAEANQRPEPSTSRDSRQERQAGRRAGRQGERGERSAEMWATNCSTCIKIQSKTGKKSTAASSCRMFERRTKRRARCSSPLHLHRYGSQSHLVEIQFTA